MNVKNFNPNPLSILELSKRTVTKLLKRANIGCSLCDWNKASCDIHHIKPKYNGGSDEMTNLILVCPNCHRQIHQTNFISQAELTKKNLAITFPNWRDFYNPPNLFSSKNQPKRKRIRAIQEFCINCGGKVLNKRNKTCGEKCASVRRKKFEINQTEIDLWKEQKLNLTQIGKIKGVSANAIKKRFKSIGEGS